MNGRPTDAALAAPWLGEAWKSMRFLQLFAFTVLALLLVPLQLRFRALWLVLSLLYLDAVLVALTVGGHRARLRWTFLAGWVLVLALKVAPVDAHLATGFYLTSRIVVVMLLGGCIAATLEYVLRDSEVTMDRIFAAIVAYMLVGLGFAAAYQAIIALAPESFALPAAPDGTGAAELVEVQLIYFSFVTLATLGYGDITPRLPLAQMLAVVEAITGQFYVAVVIAWLVSTYAARRRSGA
ncbi:MAG TPA: potassium channel family protein [Methylomirabilota bacterium]|nr:potassium channel family protein [Methylomirabilota bacterium]